LFSTERNRGFAISDAALRLFRPLVRVTSLIAPRTIGRLAFQAFCTPPRQKQGNANRNPAVKSASARLADARQVAIPFLCGSVAAFVFEPAHPPAPPAQIRTVILVHGWSGQAAYMTAFVAPLVEAGFRVVAFDLPAHGASTGSELNIPIGVASLTAVARAFAPVHALVTHSFGGSIALAALAGTVPGQPRTRVDRLAMIAAPSSMAGVTRRFGSTIGLGARGQRALERRIHVVAGAPVEAFEGRAQLDALRLPTLVLHCRDDRELGLENARDLAAAGDFVRLETLAGVGHRRILQAKAAVRSVADFVTG
jgi:pimeloyl-ACP methyl ester carboxylesterase